VLPVGGVREKVLAAHRAGLKTVILPKRNLKDLVDVPKRVRSDLRIVPVEHMDKVLEVALAPQPQKAKPIRARGRSARPKAEEGRGSTAEAHTTRPPGDVLPSQPGVT
jgi:ATP-dependent Lon protease